MRADRWDFGGLHREVGEMGKPNDVRPRLCIADVPGNFIRQLQVCDTTVEQSEKVVEVAIQMAERYAIDRISLRAICEISDDDYNMRGTSTDIVVVSVYKRLDDDRQIFKTETR
jgi:adenylate kinase family enzyme